MEELEKPDPILFDPLKLILERTLADHFETRVGVEHWMLLTEPERRNRIWRCRLNAEDSFVPETVIIKQVSPAGYAPSNPESWDTKRFFNDWAGAKFLSEIALEEKHGPEFYGGNIELGFIGLEDMGEESSLVDPLLKGDAASATSALIAYAERLGQMHASSIGAEATYRRIQRDISPAWATLDLNSSLSATETITKQINDFAEICPRLGVDPGEEAKKELSSALQKMQAPGAFTAFIHGDPCPDNVFYHAPDLRLIDFEFSCFGHALRDGLYGRLPFPTCWCANAIPSEVVLKMENAYRVALAVRCPEALDDRLFSQEATIIAAFWAINSLIWHLDEALKQDDQWGIAGTRARILTRIGTFIESSSSYDQLPALREVFSKLLAELQNSWPEATPLPYYPAFRDNIETSFFV